MTHHSLFHGIKPQGIHLEPERLLAFMAPPATPTTQCEGISQAFARWRSRGVSLQAGNTKNAPNDISQLLSEALERRVMTLAPSAVVRGPFVLQELGIIPGKGHLQSLEIAITSADEECARQLPEGVRAMAHGARWRSILMNSGCIAPPTGEDQFIPRLSPGAALAELLIFYPSLSPPADSIDFAKLAPSDRTQLRRMTGLLNAGPIREAYQHLRHQHLRRLEMRNQAP